MLSVAIGHAYSNINELQPCYPCYPSAPAAAVLVMLHQQYGMPLVPHD